MRIDKIYILSLNPTQETINKILSKLELIKLKQNIPYDIIEGHDGWNLPVPDGVHLWEGFGLGDKTDNEHWKLEKNILGGKSNSTNVPYLKD